MPLHIPSKYIIAFILFGIVPLLLLSGFYLTGYDYIPVDYTVGTCRKDYTKKKSYENRSAPLKSTSMELDGADILICYGGPSTEQRNVFGSQVSFDEVWELGANEPTRFYTNKDLVLGEVVVPKGRYSLYAIPGRWDWEIFISESISHWGNEIDEKVREKEIGSFEVKPEYNPGFVKELVFRTSENKLIIEWGKTRIVLPVENLESGKETRHTTILSKFNAAL